MPNTSDMSINGFKTAFCLQIQQAAFSALDAANTNRYNLNLLCSRWNLSLKVFMVCFFLYENEKLLTLFNAIPGRALFLIMFSKVFEIQSVFFKKSPF